MKEYIDYIREYVPKCDQEEYDKKMILSIYDNIGDKILDRNTLFAHMSASGFVLNKDFTKILMVYHNIFDSWAWTGGHADNDHDLFNVAKNEVLEETGIKNLKPLTSDIVSIEVLPVYKHIKNGKYVPNHLHLNITYCFIGDEADTLHIKEDENSGVMWIDTSKLNDYVKEKRMIPVYQKIINQAKEAI